MALSASDRSEIEMVIIATLNKKLDKLETRLRTTESRLSLLIGFLAGSGILTGIGFGIYKAVM